MTKVAEFCAILVSNWLVAHYRNMVIDNNIIIVAYEKWGTH